MEFTFHEKDLQFKNQYQIVKSEKYETLCVSKVIIWSQNLVAGVRHGNSLVVRQVSPGSVLLI